MSNLEEFKKMTDSFPCTSCGECCRNIGHIPELKDFDLGDGVCKFLKDGLCSIYETRPDICQVDKMFDKKYHKFYTKEEFYNLNISVCGELQLKAKKEFKPLFTLIQNLKIKDFLNACTNYFRWYRSCQCSLRSKKGL
jgi:Fe-S-cluster containining protein